MIPCRLPHGPEARDVAGSCLFLALAFLVGMLALNLAPAFDGILR